MRRLVVAALFAFPLAVHAQASTVSPGMSHAQVVAALGEPATSRTASEYTYLFYKNDCGRTCGMNDLVVLRRDSVVDAIFRSPARHYTGTSSSPTEDAPEVARVRPARAAARAKATVPPAGASWTTPPSTTAERHAIPAKPAAAAVPIAKDAAKPAAPVTAPKPVTSAQPAPKKPSAPNDTRPSVPAGEPAVRKAPATTPAPAPKPVVTPATKPPAKPAP
jgi:hypothetical protein